MGAILAGGAGLVNSMVNWNRVRACCQNYPSFRRKPESRCCGSGTALLQQAIPAPAPAGMTKMRLFNTRQSNLTTHPSRHRQRVLRQRFVSGGLAGEPSLPASQIPACAGMTVEGAGMTVWGAGTTVEGAGMTVWGAGTTVEGAGMTVWGAGMTTEVNHPIGNAAGGCQPLAGA